ncbi:MAG TPA: hypothetical protein VGF83_07565 [Actinomycetota bacterium]|jgi:hypothetical protein
MAGTTKNEILWAVEDAIDALGGPDGLDAGDVLRANRAALIILHRIANDLAVGSYERSKQERRKERAAAQLFVNDVLPFGV